MIKKLLPLILLLIGAGCANTAAIPEQEAEAIDLHAGATLTIAQRNWLGLGDGGQDARGDRTVLIDAWETDKQATVSWRQEVVRETAASVEARINAAKAPIGQPIVIPEPVYETVAISGLVTTDALNNAERILLPAYWPEGNYDVSGQQNSVLWLSRQQYDELVSTRSSHIQLGLFDSTLQGVVDFSDKIQSAIGKLQGEIAQDETNKRDFTELTAGPDWGSAIIKINGVDTKVRTVVAENAFASYVILANPENPLILKVSLRPWALGWSAFWSLFTLKDALGYEITEIGL